MSPPDLVGIAAWEPGLVRGGVGLLTCVAERLPGWRIRMEAVGRQLEAATCWSGPAAASAAEVLIRLSTATTAVGEAWDVSLAAFQLVVGQTEAAHALAAEARACAAGIGRGLTAGGELDQPVPLLAAAMAPDQAQAVAERAAMATRATALAAEALDRGALAAAAADQADDALRVVGVAGARAPATFADLDAAMIVPAGLPFLVHGSTPAQVAAWWAGLSAGAQLTAIDDDPVTIGRSAGVPAWARDRANRLLLARALATPGAAEQPAVIAVAGQLAAADAAGRPAQLWEFDPVAGVVAVALGDLDTADSVGVLVPGMNTTVAGDLGPLLTSAEAVADAARAAAPALTVATLAWIGYRAPQGLPAAARRSYALRGGPVLATDLAGLAASRAATGHAEPRTTVLAHSYGTVVVDEAADAPGRLAADAVVLMGSPGMEADGALRHEAGELYDAIGGRDLIGFIPWFGVNPWQPRYGAALLPTDREETHSSYYDPAHPTLAALGAVVAGRELPP